MTWLAIHPLPLGGDPEVAVAELLWARVDEASDARAIRALLATLVEGGDLDAERALDWAVFRCVDYWRWGEENGLSDDPRRCERIIEALAEPG